MSKLVAPSILSADFANLQKEISAVAQAGADWIHVDVMDGHFVDNITIGVPVVASLKKISPLPLDVHLMIEEPEKYVEAFIKAGSDWLTIHVEATKDPESVLRKIRGLGAKAGLTLRPRTPLSMVLPFLHLCDLVLVMSVEPGFGGQAFMPEQMQKVADKQQLKKQKGYSYLVEVDGGVNDQTLQACREADVLVAGSYVFKNDYQKAIRTLKLG